MPIRIECFLCTSLACASLAAAEPEVAGEEMPRIPPVAPDRAAATFALPPAVSLSLAAAEPDVSSPVAIAFDEWGALFVCEMRDYPLPEMREKKLGRIRKLTDRDGDGRYESATAFLADLPWPTGVTCSNGGVLVLATPDLIFAKDTNGDGVADERRVVATGFGSARPKPNVQALPNSLQWGPDGRIWGATAGNGGSAGKVRLDGADFSLNCGADDLRAESGTAQYGMTFDPSGRRFVCSNSHHIQWVEWERWQGGTLAGPPSVLVDIPADGPAAPVFRRSPDEPWRIVRTRWRASGLSPGIVEGGGRVSGYFTSASGIHCYAGDSLPAEFRGNFFVGDVGSNLVHRKIVRESADRLEAIRDASEANHEFLASTDNWFRPVAFADGPDGALYVVDMYREVIEHPDSLPPAIKKHLDLASGAERGRIWRISGRETPRTRSLPGAATTPELVAMLASPNGWHRSTAQRLLCERRDPEATGPLKQSTSPLALAVLAQRTQLTTADVRRVLTAGGAESRRLAVRFLESANDVRGAGAAELRDRLASETDPFLLVELAGSLAPLNSTERVEILKKLQGAGAKFQRVRQAVLLALKDANEAWSLAQSSQDDRLWSLLGGHEPLRSEISTRLAAMPPGEAAPLWAALGAKPVPDPLLAWAREHWELRGAVPLLVLSGNEQAALERIFLTNSPHDALRREALSGLAPQRAAAICAAWSRIPAGLRQDFLEWCLRRAESTEALLAAMEQGQPSVSELNHSQAERLRGADSESVRNRALKLLGPPPPNRQEMIALHQPALKMAGDAKAGEVIYRQRCLQCHRHGNEGNAIGPDRVTFRNLGKPTLLVNLLDPNRDVAPAYSVVSALKADGETMTGLLVSENSGTVVLKLPTGQEVTLPAREIRRLDRVSRSLMPEGLEAGLSDEDLAGLLEFLIQ